MRPVERDRATLAGGIAVMTIGGWLMLDGLGVIDGRVALLIPVIVAVAGFVLLLKGRDDR